MKRLGAVGTPHRIFALFAAFAFCLSAPLSASRQPVRARHGMVVAMEPIAADVGVSILENGGNAVDAAVAVGFALAVTHPSAGNLGGGGFMLIRLNKSGETVAIDYREMAPGGATRTLYQDREGNVVRDASTVGYRAIA